VSLELAPGVTPLERPASAGRPRSTPGLSQPLSGFRRLELRGLVSCRKPFARFPPFRGFPSQESQSPWPRPTMRPGSTLPAPLWFSTAPSLRDRLSPSLPVSTTPVREANPSPACRCPPDSYGVLSEPPPPSPLQNRQPGFLDPSRSPWTPTALIAARVWPRPLRSLAPPASPFARAEVAPDTRPILSWAFVPSEAFSARALDPRTHRAALSERSPSSFPESSRSTG
jgi:hypothetical protein